MQDQVTRLALQIERLTARLDKLTQAINAMAESNAVLAEALASKHEDEGEDTDSPSFDLSGERIHL